MTTLLPIALGLLIQSTALLLLGLVVMRFARRHGPAVQSLIGRATLAGVALALLLAWPLAGHIRPVWRIRVGEPTPRQVAAPPETGGAGGKVVGESRLLDGAFSGQDPAGRIPVGRVPAGYISAGDHSLTHPPLTAPHPIIPLNPSTTFSAPPPVPGGAATCRGVGSLWASGTALLLLWLAFCQCHFSYLRRSAHSLTSGPASETLAALTPRPPALLTHPAVRSPFLAGRAAPGYFPAEQPIKRTLTWHCPARHPRPRDGPPRPARQRLDAGRPPPQLPCSGPSPSSGSCAAAWNRPARRPATWRYSPRTARPAPTPLAS